LCLGGVASIVIHYIITRKSYEYEGIPAPLKLARLDIVVSILSYLIFTGLSGSPLGGFLIYLVILLVYMAIAEREY
jgi:hypothetical protein